MPRMSRGPVTEDDVAEVQARAGGGVRQRSARAGGTYEAWAADPHPDDEVSLGRLLVMAGEQWAYAGETDRALQLFRRAVQTGDRVEPDVRCYLIDALLGAGQRDEADKLAEELRRSRPGNPDAYLFVGDAYEEAGDLGASLRWFTSGMLKTLKDEAADEVDVVLLIRSRRRVREAMGFPPDEYDELADLRHGPVSDAW